jgi:phosphate-selective porin OprO/OprP
MSDFLQLIFKRVNTGQKSGASLAAWLLVILLAGLPFLSYSQENKKTIPDGTEGETMEVPDSTATPTALKPNLSWNTVNLGFTTFKIGLGALFEYGGFKQDETGQQQMDSAKVKLEHDFKVRDFRFLFSGKFKTKRTITWRAGVMSDVALDKWFIRESGFMIEVPELWGSFFIGRTKEGASMVKVMNGYSPETMERYMASDAIPILADGIKWLGYMPKPRIFWNIGAFTDIISEGQSFSTYSSQFITRIGWLPIHSPETRKNFHVAGNFRIGKPVNNTIQIRSRPEANPAPYFIDSGKFPSKQSVYLGGEMYYSTGPWFFGTEYYWDRFSSPEKSNPVFHGGEVFASYILTGETRPYNTALGIYTFIPVSRPLFKGGAGAFEAALRFSRFDLDDGPIEGGKFWRITPTFNWYPTKTFRLILCYGYGELDRFNLKGATQFFQSRVQILIM